MKKVLAFSLIVLLASPIFAGCKSGTSCFTRNGSRVPIIGSSSSDYDDAVASSTGSRVVNAYPTNEVMMMNTSSAYSACEPCAPAQTQCNPCDPCGVNRSNYVGSTGAYPGDN